MMSFLKHLLTCVLIATTALLTATAIAQERDDKEKARQELEKKTLGLLNDVASAAWSLKLTENRAFALANAAHLFWTHDQKRARSLYWDALNALNVTPAAKTPAENGAKAEPQKVLDDYYVAFAARQKLLRQVAQRDAQLALEMLRATRQVAPRQSASEVQFPDDRQLEREIVSEVAGRDPAQALQLARESLAKGLSFQLFHLLLRLNQKDPEKATQFAGDIIAKLRSTNIATDARASTLALQLLQVSRPPDGDRRGTLSQPGLDRRLALTDEQRRDLVDVVTNAALSVSANSSLLFQIPAVMADVEKFFPERRVPLERKLAAFNQTLNKEQRDHNIYSDLIRTGQFEELVRKAAAADATERMTLYQQAAIIAVSRDKADVFRDFVSKEIKDNDQQKQVLDLVDAQELEAAIYQKRLEQIQKLLPKIRRKEDRARAMVQLALLLKAKGDDHEATTLLDEAASMIKTDLKSETQTNALLALLHAYALVDPAKAFALAERTVDHANSQVATLVFIDRVVKSGAIKKGEILLEQGRVMPLDMLLFQLGDGIKALARADFNRTKALADRFERNELRVMARLLVLKGLLDGN